MRKVVAALAAAVLLGGCGTAVPSSPGGQPPRTPAPTASSPAGQAETRAVERSYEQVIKQVLPSIVQINTNTGLGSGIVYDTKGHIITNAHVIGQAKEVTVTLANSNAPRQATVVKSFRAGDLAVIKVLDPKGLSPATFGDSSKLQVGQLVLAMGNPLGLSGSVTNGIISALGRTVTEPEEPPSPGATISGAIQTSAAINPGNSGGGLVDLYGRVIGIPTLAATDPELGGGPAPGIGFAIPSNTATDLASQIIKSGKVTNSHRAALGLNGSTLIGADNQPSGVAVAEVQPGGAADKAGIRPGDVISAVNDTPTTSMAALSEEMTKYKPGVNVKVKVVRPDGSTDIVTVTLGELQGD
ncbi:trypsin-like peptidase domain-containing protein [Nonomuraea sp. NPDC000554]|uniref:S1C family serine protease n=1 Tax=Nonomuraea sp. NPDC000554 TaxID=3154259 RepID=UPI00332116FC